MKKDQKIFLQHIFESITFIESFSKKLTKEKLAKNRMRQNAIVRELEIIGEAVKNLSPEFMQKHENVPWSDIARTRDKLIHHYFGVDISEVWDIVKEDLPKLKRQIQEILKS